jgi:predicted RNase H-like HicB family nuclease
MSVIKVKFLVRVIVEKDEGGYHGYCPDLKGLHVFGKTSEEAKANAKHAAIAYIGTLIKHGDPIPVGFNVEGAGARTPSVRTLKTKRKPQPVPDLVRVPVNC